MQQNSSSIFIKFYVASYIELLKFQTELVEHLLFDAHISLLYLVKAVSLTRTFYYSLFNTLRKYNKAGWVPELKHRVP